MMHISDVKQTDIIDAFNTTSRYLDDILSLNNIEYNTLTIWESQICPSESFNVIKHIPLMLRIRKKETIRNRYKQTPQLTQDTI